MDNWPVYEDPEYLEEDLEEEFEAAWSEWQAADELA